MCGIAGAVWRDTSRPADVETTAAMCQVLSHRGPDDAGVYCSGPVALGHRRLAILDPSGAGHQPMLTHDRRHVLVFNGEIYNYVELRTELKALGHQFRSDTDSEVILCAFRQWGADCVTRFNGMWAFALYDRIAGKLLLSRDRFGIKPLYYLLDESGLVFASEIKALLVARPKYRRVRRDYLARFLVNGLLDDTSDTAFSGVQSLQPAQSALYDIDAGALHAWSYWLVDRAEFAARWQRDDAVQTLGALLDSAVRLHTRADVPVGSCLSGGIDSSAIVSLMSRHHDQPVRTFSGLYGDDGYDEEPYVRAVNGHVRTMPFHVRPEPRGNLLAELAQITWHQDEPTAGPGLYTQFHVMRCAAAEVKVVLDGQGSDELFAGYLHYLRDRVRDLCTAGNWRARAAAWKLVAAANWHWPGALEDGWRLLGHRLLHAAAWLINRVRRRGPQVLSANPLHRALQDTIYAGAAKGAAPAGAHGALTDMLEDQLLRTSIPALLHYEDRNSMAFSVEARVPYLDYRIVEFALSLDTSYMIRGSWTKWCLRKATERLLPPQVTWRRSKLGYATPMARWLRQGSDRDDARELLFSRELRERELVDGAELERIWRAHQGGRDYSWLLYRLITTELWHRHFIDKLEPCSAVTPRPQSVGRIDIGDDQRLAS